MELKNGVKTYFAKSRNAWRNWLSKNHDKEKSVWLIYYKKNSGVPSITYKEAVDEALCFGWIDSTINKRDDQSVYQYFTKRKPKSNWSKVNKDKVKELIASGLMTAAGLEAIEIAKENGMWNASDEIENLTLPDDLQKLFRKNKTAFTHWENFSKSSRKVILGWIASAKRTETRSKRIQETVNLASKNIKAYP